MTKKDKTETKKLVKIENKPTFQETMIWVLKTILKERKIFRGDIMIPTSKLNVKPYFNHGEDMHIFEHELQILFYNINIDIDFFIEWDIEPFVISFTFNNGLPYPSYDYITFNNLTEDFVKKYLKRLGVKNKKEQEKIEVSKINLSEIGFKSMNHKDILIWFLKNLKNISHYNTAWGGLEIPEKDVEIIFNHNEDGYLEEEVDHYLMPIVKDRDFLRKHSMQNYDLHYVIESGNLCLKDFTDDFVDLYLEDRLGVKNDNKNISNNKKNIQKIEIMIPTNEWEGIKMFINSNYNKPIKFKNGKYIELFYTLAQNQRISSSRGLVSYFNSNKANLLYKRTSFDLSKILTKNGNSIEPNIPILLRSKKFISHAINKASKENKKLNSA